MPDQNFDGFVAGLEDAIAYGGPAVGENHVAAFDAAAAHVACLLQDAYAAFWRESYGTSVFLAITAIEETAKAELLIYRSSGDQATQKKGRDPLKDHGAKHRIAIRPTTFMSERLKLLIGDEACARLQVEASSGSFQAFREQAIYFEIKDGEVVTPEDVVSAKRAREILLLSLECAHDVLVGYTTLSFTIGRNIEVLYRRFSRRGEATCR